MENVLYVLGAGASIGGKYKVENEWLKSMRVPSGTKFFYDSFRQYNPDGSFRRYLNKLGLTFEGLYNFMKQAYRVDANGFNPRDWEKINLEDVLSFIDIGESMYVENSPYKKAFRHLKKSLLMYIEMEIRLSSEEKECQNLTTLFGKLGIGDSIFTFNYDLIAERSLIAVNAVQYSNYLDFMDSYERRKSIYQKGIYLKLHGSIDWGICENPKCSRYDTAIFDKNMATAKTMQRFLPKCTSCNRQQMPAIIPPTSNKVKIRDNRLYHKMWIVAKNQLAKYKIIVFYGYSFPKTDYYAEWLFRNINFHIDEDNKNVIYQIHVINPQMLKKSSETYKRYYTLFKGHEIRAYGSLDQYLNEFE